jgi:hypothetical protein
MRIQCPVCRKPFECDLGPSGREAVCPCCRASVSVSSVLLTDAAASRPERVDQQFAFEEGIDLNERFVRTVANESEAEGQLLKWQCEMPAVPSAYEPSGALPASAVLFLLLGSVVGCVAGLFAGAVIGSAGITVAGVLLFDDFFRSSIPGATRGCLLFDDIRARHIRCLFRHRLGLGLVHHAAW